MNVQSINGEMGAAEMKERIEAAQKRARQEQLEIGMLRFLLELDNETVSGARQRIREFVNEVQKCN